VTARPPQIPFARAAVTDERRQNDDAAPERRHNLGLDLTRFVGRDDLRARITALVDGGARLVSLTGAAGIGKTRLAREWARDTMGREPGLRGCWFCDLSSVTSGEGVVAAIVEAVEPDADQRTWRPGDFATQLHMMLRARGRIVLVLDNLEQVVEAAATTIEGILDACPEATIIVTSRARLRLRAEHALEVNPLDARPAVELFIDRVHAVGGPRDLQADHERLHAIVDRLDRIPLAIELAAGRFAILGMNGLRNQLGERLGTLRATHRDVPARHRTLDAAVGWSWELLVGWERAALAQLSVFAGGFDLAAAEAVVHLEPFADAPHIIEVVATLSDYSLVHVYRPTETGHELRYRLLAPIAAFMATRAGDAGADLDAARRRHAQHYATLSERLKARAVQAGEPQALVDLAIERQNIIAAHMNVRDSEPAFAARLALAAQSAWVDLGRDERTSELLESAVACAERAGDPQLHARTLRHRGGDLCKRGRVDLGRLDFERAKGLAVEPVTRALLDLDLAQCDIVDGRPTEALAVGAAAAEDAAAIGGPSLELRAAMVAGAAAADTGDLDAARSYFERALGRPRGYQEVVALAWLSVIALEAGDDAAALDYAVRAGELAERRPPEVIALSARMTRGSVRLLLGRWKDARVDLATTSRVAADAGLLQIHGYTEAWRAIAALEELDLDGAAAAAATALRYVPSGLHRGRAAVEVVATAVDELRRGQVPPGVPDTLAQNQLARLFGRALSSLSTRFAPGDVPAEAIRVAANGTWFQVPGEPPVDLHRRKRIDEILVLLAKRRIDAPGVGVSATELYAAGWPGASLSEGSGINRVYVIIASLRRLGLANHLIKGPDGYLFNPGVSVELVTGGPGDTEPGGRAE